MNDDRTSRSGVLYAERTAFPALKYGVMAVAGTFVLLLFDNRAVGAEGLLWAGGGAAAVLVICLVVWQLPVVGEGRKIQVDRDGLHAGRAHLPTNRIGQVMQVAANEAATAMYDDVDGVRRVARTHTFISGGARPAVLVLDTQGGEHPYWLVETSTPEDFLQALETARKQG